MNTTALADDEGFGLVEAVVSMLILAALAIAFLPLLITGVKQSAANSTLALATQLVADRMSLAQASTTCSALLDVLATSASAEDPRGQVIDVDTTMAPADCSALPATFELTAVARLVEADGTVGDELASATTLVFLQ